MNVISKELSNMNTSRIYHGGGPLKRNYSTSGSSSSDELVKVSAADTTPGYLDPKIVGGSDVTTGSIVTTVILNPGADEDLEISAINNKIAITLNDTRPTYLDGKLSAGGGLGRNILNPGAVEIYEMFHNGTLLNTVNDSSASFLSFKLAAGAGITLTTLNPGGNEQTEIAGDFADIPKMHTLTYSTPGALGPGTLIPAATSGTWAGAGQGYNVGNASRLREVHFCVNRFTCFAPQNAVFGIRYIAADGSRTTVVTSASGTFVRSLQIDFPNSSGSFRYYMGGHVGSLSDLIPAGSMIFCYVVSKTVNSMTGVDALLLLEDD